MVSGGGEGVGGGGEVRVVIHKIRESPASFPPPSPAHFPFSRSHASTSSGLLMPATCFACVTVLILNNWTWLDFFVLWFSYHLRIFYCCWFFLSFFFCCCVFQLQYIYYILILYLSHSLSIIYWPVCLSISLSRSYSFHFLEHQNN